MNSHEDKSVRSYNQKADNYDKTYDGKFTKRFKELLLKEINIENNNTILDVACGNGTFFKMISNEYNIKGYGVDISDMMVENARKKCPDMTFKTSSCENTPFGSDKFDVVTVRSIVNPFVSLSKAGDVKFYSHKEIQSNFEKYNFKMMNFKRKGYIQIIELKKI